MSLQLCRRPQQHLPGAYSVCWCELQGGHQVKAGAAPLGATDTQQLVAEGGQEGEQGGTGGTWCWGQGGGRGGGAHDSSMGFTPTVQDKIPQIAHVFSHKLKGWPS